MTKEEILKAMKEKYDITDEKMDKYLRPTEIKIAGENCSVDDPECLSCGG